MYLIFSILVATFCLFRCFYHYYSTFIIATPVLYGANSSFCAFLRQKCPIINEPYRPPIWCFHKGPMTILGVLVFRNWRAPTVKYFREYLDTPDGGRLALDWDDQNVLGPEVIQPSPTPIALFLPGLTGTSSEAYIRLAVSIARKIGYRSVVVNYRGLAGTELLTTRISSELSDDDLQVTLQFIRSREKAKVKILAVGYSFGGNILTRYLRNVGSESLVDAAFLISPCFDYNKCTVNLRTGFWHRILNLVLAQWLAASVLAHPKIFQDQFSLKSFRWFTQVDQFVDAYRSILGFGSVEEYYREVSKNVDGLPHIRVPTLALSSGDDPCSLESNLPVDLLQKCDQFQWLVTRRGGHMSFLEGPWRLGFYTERVFEQYASAIWTDMFGGQHRY